MKLVWSAVFALGLASVAAADDDEKGAPRKYSDVEIEALLDLAARVNKLEEAQQDTELERLKKAAAKEKQEEMENLPKRVSQLEKNQASAGQTWDAAKMLSFSTADGNFTAKIGGRIYSVYRHIFERNDEPANAGGAPDQFIVDTARIQLDGSFFKDFYYRVEYTSEKNAAALYNDTYIGWQGLPDYFRFQFGQFKVPFSQEETCSSRFIDFAERSLINRLIPSRDQGFMFFGSFANGVVDWAAGVFNGNTKNTADLADEKDAAFRLMLSPLRNSDVRLFKQLRIGVDATIGQIDGPSTFAAVTHTGAITDGDLGGLSIIPFGAGALLDGDRLRYVVNFSWIYGPFSLRAEYLTVNYELIDTAAESDFEITGFYVQATFLLTGEDKTLENRIKPNNNFHPLEGKWGAWELALRFASLDATDAEDAGLIAVGTNQEADQITVGINWWWAPNVVWRINYEMLKFDEDLVGIKTGNENEDKQNIFYVRFQIDF